MIVTYSHKLKQFVAKQRGGQIRFHFLSDGNYVFGKSLEEPLLKEKSYNSVNQLVQTTRQFSKSVKINTENVKTKTSSGEFSRHVLYDLYNKQNYKLQQTTLLEQLLLAEKLICQTAFIKPPLRQPLTELAQIKSDKNDKAVQAIIRAPISELFLVCHGDRDDSKFTYLNLYSLANVFYPEKQILLRRSAVCACFNQQLPHVAAVGCEDGSVEIVDFLQCKTLFCLNQHSDTVTGVAWRSGCVQSCQFLLTCALDGLVCYYKFQEGALSLVYQWKAMESGTELDRLKSETQVPKTDKQLQITSMAVLDNYLALGCANGYIQVYQMYDKQPTQTMCVEKNGHGLPVYKLQMRWQASAKSSPKLQIFSCGEDQSLRCWTLGEDLSRVVWEHFLPINDLVLDGAYLIAVTATQLTIIKNEVPSYVLDFHQYKICKCEIIGKNLLVGREDSGVDVFAINYDSVVEGAM